jgi:hypothetical protein
MMRHLGTIDLWILGIMDFGDNAVVLVSLYERNLPSGQLGLEKPVGQAQAAC